MNEIGKMMVIGGLLIAAIGALLWLLPDKTPIGHMPGDINVEKPGLSFHFPVMTCILVSAALSLVMWLVEKFKN